MSTSARGSHNPPFLTLAAALSVATLTIAAPAHAQFTKSGNAYYVTGDYTLKTDVSDNEVFVGKDTAFKPPIHTVTLTVDKGARTTSIGTVQNGVKYTGLNVFGNHRLFISGGNVADVNSYDTGRLYITRGSVTNAASEDASTMIISGGSVTNADSYGASTMMVGGFSDVDEVRARENSTMFIDSGQGSIKSAEGFESSTTRIRSGRVLTHGLYLTCSTAKADIIGLDLSYKYMDYGTSQYYKGYSDRFAVTGKIGDFRSYRNIEVKTVYLYINNTDGVANSTARQFTFNGRTPVAAVAPKLPPLALLLPGLGLLGAVIVRRGGRGV